MSRLLNLHPSLLGGGAERGERAAVLLHDDAVAAAKRHVVSGVVVEDPEPDAAGVPGPLDSDLRHVRHDRDAAGLGQHGSEPPRRDLDWIDAGVGDATHDADRRAIAGDAADFDLRVGSSAWASFLGDGLAELVGGFAGSLQLAGVRDVDVAGLVDRDRLEGRHLLAGAGEEAGLDVLPDPDRQCVAGADGVGREDAGADEVRAEAEGLPEREAVAIDGVTRMMCILGSVPARVMSRAVGPELGRRLHPESAATSRRARANGVFATRDPCIECLTVPARRLLSRNITFPRWRGQWGDHAGGVCCRKVAMGDSAAVGAAG